MKEQNYWDDRANMEYEYKREKFYTITAIPYYYKRREIILDKINALMCDNYNICDFGCGDGEYIRILSKKNKTCSFHGVDISAEMIEVAKNRNQNAKITWEISGDGIHEDMLFDVIYSSAIFAHVTDEEVFTLLSNIYKHIMGGNVCSL